MKILKSHIGSLIIVTGAIVLLTLLVQYFQPGWIHSRIWQVIIFYFGLMLLSGQLIQFLLKQSEENSVAIVMGATIIRFLASLIFIAICLFTEIDNKILFFADFFVIYLLYLLFDIYSLIANLRPHSK
ncbi:hypothetical protein GCM10007049_15110 [Echinicola pacifica]|uniref:Uncharacterized protein n=1 Tax=Echinicola pacifica TaxID=346377 RepID=A0A918PUE9_9BACT|nr:hypothetical protein [Echinicola pacifica]GGZ23196.1 hypothetical protein GCM10007049_15110 [Echinicola pacifica]